MQTIINELIAYANKNKKGFTIQLKKGKIHRVIPSEKLRYVFAYRELIVIENFYEKVEMLIEKPVVTKTIRQRNVFTIYPYLYDKTGKLKENNIFIGGWFNEKTNSYFIELVKIFDNKTDAMLNGKMLNQHSVYDLLKKKELIVKEYFDLLQENELMLLRQNGDNVTDGI